MHTIDRADFSKEAPNMKHKKHLEKLVNLLLDIPMEEIDGRGLGGVRLMVYNADDFDIIYKYILHDILNLK